VQRRAARENIVSERDQRGLKVIASQADRLSRLINSLLDVSSIQSGHFNLDCRPIDLCEIIEEFADDIGTLLDGHELEIKIPDVPVFINGDALRLEMVFQNLIQNAVKYSPNGGIISLTVTPRTADVAISVSDQGIGIPESAMPRLFQRFFRATSVAETSISGMGIGLFVVHEIISRHGGQVEVSSEEGIGSTFVIYLPLLNTPVPASNADGEVAY
jgi:signal transduction histidine kinase